MQIKLISTRMVEHLTSFWYRGPGEHGNGLFKPYEFNQQLLRTKKLERETLQAATGTLLVYLAVLARYLPTFSFLIVYLISGPASSNIIVSDLFSLTLLFLNSSYLRLENEANSNKNKYTILRNIFQSWQPMRVDKNKPEILKFLHILTLSFPFCIS